MRAIFSFLIFSLLMHGNLPAQFSESPALPWGPDMEFLKEAKNLPKPALLRPAQKTCRSMIRFFQVYISPIDGPRSSFYPTSSQYALEAIQKYGVLKGITMGCDRLMRENKELWVYPTTNKYGIERKLDPVR
jgi:hypothetical protein